MKKLYPSKGRLLFPVIFFFQILFISSFILPVTSFAQCSPPVLVVNQPAPVCSPGTVDITAPGILDMTQSNIPEGTSFTYTNAGNNTIVNSPSNINTSGNYIITATVSNSDGSSCSSFAIVTVLINQTPAITLVNPGPYCST